MILVIVGSPLSGKTTVLKEFDKRGVKVFHADQHIREIYRKGEVGYNAIRDVFGEEYVNDQEVDRMALSELVKASEEELNRLNETIHPLLKEYLEGKDGYVAELPIVTTSSVKFNYDKMILVKADDLEIESRYEQKYGNVSSDFIKAMINQWNNDIDFDYVIDTTNGVDNSIIDKIIEENNLK